MQKKRILFVDDQPNILNGLRRMLRRLRHEFEMKFVESGAEALRVMEQKEFDAIVADMRMPEMNGAQLLKEVSKKHPGTLRFILSGHSDRELILQTVGVAHQYLAKPCEPESLKRLLVNSSGLREMLNSDEIHKRISMIDTLPTLPDTYNELVAELQSESSSIKSIAGIIGRDVSMTAKLFQMINSAFFGLPTRVTDVFQAVNLLGLDTTRALVLAAGVFRQFADQHIPGYSIESVYNHSLSVGAMAQRLARYLDMEQRLVDDAMLAGVMHDIGKLIMVSSFADEVRSIAAIVEEKGIAPEHVEWEVLNVTHAEIGGHLLSMWGLPDAILEAIVYHHAPSRVPIPAPSVLTAVYLANVFEQYPDDHNFDDESVDIDKEYLQAIGLADRIPELQDASTVETV